MAHDWGTAEGAASMPKRINVWMIIAIIAIVVAIIAGYLVFSYRQQVEDWEAAASETLATLQAAGVELQDTVVSSVAEYEQQISDLSSELEQTQTQAEVSAAGQADAEQQLADTQSELETTQAELETSQAELESTQAELDDAEAKLEQLGELALPDGTYIGPVLGARTEPIPAIIFEDDGAWRVAEVASDATITSGGQTFTLEEFSALLRSTDPADANLVNGDYQVIVRNGLVTSLRKSVA